jgi:DNA-binding LacI/PurR family transcriptional regulator
MSLNNPTRRPTIYDVAERAGVSPSLVSLVLQNSPKVSQARRTAVLSAIAELGYRPSRAATTLASRKTKSIGLVIDDYRNLWFVGLLHGMQSVLTDQGYQVSVADAPPEGHHGAGAIDGLLSMHVDGLVIAMEPSDFMLKATWVPTVVAGWRDRLPEGADLIANDDETGGFLAARHLLDLGHTRIGHLSGSGGAAYHRCSGFRDAARKAGLELPVVTGERNGTSEEDGYSAACRLFDLQPETTAIFAANDTMAVGALAAIRSRGLAVPQHVSVIGYDNSPLAQSRYLDLTSVDDRSEDVGADVARALLARIEDPDTEPRRTLITPSVIARSTTARHTS